MLRVPSLGELDQGLRVRVYLCTSPTDMRKGFDTLAVLVRDGLGYDPLSGHLFLFVGRRRDRLKILYWDQDGYALWYKRLEQGTFRMPVAKPDAASIELKASEFGDAAGRDRPAKHQAPQAIPPPGVIHHHVTREPGMSFILAC